MKRSIFCRGCNDSIVVLVPNLPLVDGEGTARIRLEACAVEAQWIMEKDGSYLCPRCEGKQEAETCQDDQARAFNTGCDARLLGVPIWANPYVGVGRLGNYWSMGWMDVHKHWGRDAGRRLVRPLPPIR